MGNGNSKISIIVPVYNVEKYLERCITSIRKQTYSEIEILLIDDGSTDRSSEICDLYAEKDKRIKVIHKQNGGLSDARNAGIDIAEGQYIVFVDSDDWVHPQMIDILYRTACQNDADIVACDFAKTFEDDNTTKIGQEIIGQIREEDICFFKQEEILRYLIERGGEWLVIACCKLYKKEIFDSIRFPVNKLHEDEFVIHRTLALTQSFVYVKKPLYYYYQRKNSIMNSREKVADDDEIEAYYDRISFFQCFFPQQKLDKLIFKTIYLLMALRKEEHDKMKKNRYKQMWKTLYENNRNDLTLQTKMKIGICKVDCSIYKWVTRCLGK